MSVLSDSEPLLEYAEEIHAFFSFGDMLQPSSVRVSSRTVIA